MNNLINSVVTLLFLLILTACPNTKPPDDPAVDPVSLCNNFQKDSLELGVDCGGPCKPCFTPDIEKELLIRDVAIVDRESAKSGTLSFGHAIRRFAVGESQEVELVNSLLNTWSDTVMVNGISIAPRPRTRSTIIKLWNNIDPEAVTNNNLTKFNSDKTPFRLLAINSRFDFDITDKKVGEGRLTYGLTSGTSQFTLILECNLEGNSEADRKAWMQRWHQLSGMDISSQQYLDTLEAIVTTFSKSATQLSQLRTNEFLDGRSWEFREFNILDDGLFHEVTRKANPTSELQGSTLLLEYIDEHREEITSASIRNKFKGQDLLAGNTLYSSSFKWRVANATTTQLEALEELTFVSCVGCHGGLVPGTGFTHIKPRQEGVRSRISGFLEKDLESRSAMVRDVLGLPEQEAELKDISSAEAQRIDSIGFVINKFKGVKRVH